MKPIKLTGSTYGDEEILAALKCLFSTNVVMGEETIKAQNKWCEKYKSKFASMCNSGSSANLLLINLLTSRLGKYKFQQDDEILVQNTTWITTVTPIIQCGLKPVICDNDLKTFNISLESCKRMLTPKTKAVFYVPLLGNIAEFDKVLEFCKEHSLLLLIDACEATGVKYKGKNISQYGVGSTYSLMYSHHITGGGEGGIVCVSNTEDDDVIKSLRSHGWNRHSSIEKKTEQMNEYGFESIEEMQFVFWDIGYNFRNSEIQAVFLNHQLDKVDDFINARISNYSYFWNQTEALRENKEIFVQDMLFDSKEDTNSSPFAFGLYLNPEKYDKKVRNNLIKYLKDNGVESRKVVAGSLIDNPVFEIYSDKIKTDLNLEYSRIIDKNGIYLPLHQGIEKKDIDYMVSMLEAFLKE